MKRFRFLILVLMTNLALLHALAEEPEVTQNSRYKLGMTIEEAQKLMSKEYLPSTTGRLVDDMNPAPTGQEAEKEVRYILRVTDEGLHLFFNWNDRLIGIRDLTKRKQKEPPPKIIAGAEHEKAVRDAVLFFLENTPPNLVRPWILNSKDGLQKKEFVYDAEKRLYICDGWEVSLAKRTATIKSETEMLDGVLSEVDGALRITDSKIWKIIPRPASLK